MDKKDLNEKQNIDMNKNKKNNINNKDKKKHTLRNTIIFYILFTTICVSITIFFILKSYGSSNISDIKKIVDGTINNNEIVPDGLGIKSLDETYQENTIKISKIYITKQNSEDSYDGSSYLQISGLKDKEVESKVNNRIKEMCLERYEKIKANKENNINMYCTANFANVISFRINYSNDNNYYTEGINFNLVSGEELTFKDMFTNNAAIQNILKNSSYESISQYYNGHYRSKEYDELYKIPEGDEYDETEDWSLEDGTPVEDEVEKLNFKFMTDYKNNKIEEFYFSSRCIYVIWNEYTIKIPMKDYYSQIAIYNRYKEHNNLYEDYKCDEIENKNIPIFVSTNDIYVEPDVEPIDDMGYLPDSYFNLLKVNDNLLVLIRNGYSETIDNIEEFKKAEKIINDIVIKKYQDKSDDMAYYIQINMGFGEDYDSKDLTLNYDIDEYSVKKDDKEKFFRNVIEKYQDGLDYIRWNTDSSFNKNYFKGCDVKYTSSHSYKNYSQQYKYDKKQKEWRCLSSNDIVINEVNKRYIVIDPGHQAIANSEKEPIGPGATEMKAKSTTGEVGVVTKQKEHELNLVVAKKLKSELEKKGYTVEMTRESNDVDISNSQRAIIANEARAGAFIRIHTNTHDSADTKGVDTMCQTTNNRFNSHMADESYKLSKAVVDCVANTTGAQNRGVNRVDDTSGIDWCMVPSTIIEMGYLSNPEEDQLLATEEYQNKIVLGSVEGIEQYLNG